MTARARWLQLGLVAALAQIAAYSLGEAGWVNGPARYANGWWLAALLGAALGATRFRPLAAGLYASGFVLLAAAEAATGILPTAVIGRPWAELWFGMHVRALGFLDQAGVWAAAVVGAAAVEGAGFFIFTLTATGWAASAWLAWHAWRGGSPWLAIAPLAALVGVNHHLGARPDGEWLTFAAGALLWLAQHSLGHWRVYWDARGVSYADDLPMDWAVHSGLAAVVLVGAMAAAPWLGTPAGWRQMATWWQAAQAETAETAARLFPGVRPPPQTSFPLVSARTPDLTTLGARPPQGNDTVMWVTVSDPAPPPTQAGPAPQPPRHYWRGEAFATYTGGGWQAAPSEAAAPPDQPDRGRYPVWQRYEFEAAHGEQLFAVNRPITITGAATLVTTADDALVRGPASLLAYEVTSQAVRLGAADLRAAGQAYPPAVQAAYTQLPTALPMRVRALAQRLTAEAATPFDKAIRIQAYLRATYAYDLTTPPPPAGQDAVDYFLFDAPGGYCSYYASAMAVLLRVAGVPARVVSGYATGEFTPARGAYRVPVGAAHAWTEVYFPGYGWVAFEPTANRSAIDFAETAPAAPNRPPPPPAAAPEGALGWALLAGVALAGLGAWWWWRRPPAAENPAAVYWRIRRGLAWGGLRAPATTTVEEFLAAAGPTLPAGSAMREALSQATRLYTQAEYSPRPAAVAPTHAAAQLWARAWRERLRWWWRRRRYNKG